MKTLLSIINILSIPLLILNFGSGIVAGIWLIILREWTLLIYGILSLFVASFILSIALMPSLIFVPLIAKFTETQNKIGLYFFSLLSLLYTFSVLAAWCLVVLYFFLIRTKGDSIIPVLLWAYAVATGAIAYLASKETQNDNPSAMFPTFFAKFSFALLILIVLFFQITFYDVIMLFASIMLIGALFQFKLAMDINKE
jgi:hypothetical protein